MERLGPDGHPVPPERLIVRAGRTPGRDAAEEYLALGPAGKRMLESVIAPDTGDAWFDGRRVLDFGCGAGQILRQFVVERTPCELWGCDIDRESVSWLERNLSPPLRVFAVSDTAHLPIGDDYFDLIYAISVFTHIAEGWAAWLLELHRVLEPGGVLIVSFLGEGMIDLERGGTWDPDRIGMNVLRNGQDWDGGGPTVFHSDWWIRAHWGRAFEITDIVTQRDPTGAVLPGSHGLAVMRKRPVSLTPEALEEPERDEARELLAMTHNVEQLHDEDRRLRALLGEAIARGNSEHSLRLAAEARLAAVAGSRSWRLTGPLRKLADHRRRTGNPR